MPCTPACGSPPMATMCSTDGISARRASRPSRRSLPCAKTTLAPLSLDDVGRLFGQQGRVDRYVHAADRTAPRSRPSASAGRSRPSAPPGRHGRRRGRAAPWRGRARGRRARRWRPARTCRRPCAAGSPPWSSRGDQEQFGERADRHRISLLGQAPGLYPQGLRALTARRSRRYPPSPSRPPAISRIAPGGRGHADSLPSGRSSAW